MMKISTKNFLSILFFIFSIRLSYINTSTSCEPGYYLVNYGCAPCGAGYYSKEEDSESCDICQPGIY